MKYTSFLWILIWSGLYSEVCAIDSDCFTASLYQGVRALLPLLALFLCILSSLISGLRRVPTFKTSLELLFYYCLIGFIGAFASKEFWTSFYWCSLYLSVIFVIWYAMNKNSRMDNIRSIININYIILTVLMCTFLPRALQSGITELSDLPFLSGEVTRNGVGRYAVVVVVYSFVRLLTYKKIWRYMYLVFLVPSVYIISQTESRSALTGLAIITMIVFWLRGNWKFILIGPIFAHIIWLSGYKLRAAGDFERLFSLTGREMTWSQGIDLVVTSPIYGLGFQADRLMLEFQHMHNAYLQALIQGGILGFIFFAGAILLAWKMIFPYLFLNRLKRIPENQRPLAIESIAMIGFLTARSFVESTGAFFGIDLLILLPHICYLQLLLKEPNNKEKEAVSI